ncbi:MAG: hypothetical protein DME97_15460 [Verrucomicrobia bacterium]|nr:MAG: hypothetical protein DME97_15460 [Verrucomicrobiota bacterium]
MAVLALAFPALRQAEARTDISIDFFYDNLGDGGNWVEVSDYGYCWQPSVAVSNTSWRPYSDGYWAYTDVGWTWVSYEDFGWATYHYGRWIRLRGRGWVWVPGRDWGPAWVSWRTGGDYVGWAPLPPRRAGDIYVDFSPINSRVDIDFDIGPAYYNFIDVRYIGEPVLRERIFAADQNVTYVSKTVNVTNITYTNSTVYNYGPDYDTLSRYSTRPIQRLSLQRETNVDPAAAAQSKSLMKVQGDKLVIAAPQQFQKPTKTIAPKVVKEKVVLAQAPVERGWEPVGDQKAQTELKEKMKKEDPKAVPPPTVQASEKAETSPAATAPATTTASATPATTTASPTVPAKASPAASVTPATAASPSVSPAKDKNKKVSPAPSASASVNPATAPEKNKNKRNEKVSPLATPSASVPPATSPAPTRDKGKNKQRENVAPSASVPPATGATETTAPTVTPKPPKEKPEKRKNESAVPPPPEAPKSAPRVAPPPTPETKHKQPEPDMTKPEATVEKPKKEAPADIPKPKKEQAPQERVVPPAPAPNAPVNPPGRDEGKKQKKNEPATSPTP